MSAVVVTNMLLHIIGSDVWVSNYPTYNNGSCPIGSGYYYGQHVISSTDTIHWTLRTIPYSNQRSTGYSNCGDQI